MNASRADWTTQNISGAPEKANWSQQPHDEEGTQSQEQLLDHRFPFCLYPIAQ